jgi:predicted transcriptional regulator
MATARANDPRAFHDFLGAKLSDRPTNLTLDEALLLWEAENQSELERAETLQAIRDGLADADAGRVKDAREAIAEIRERFGFPPLP